MRLLSLVFLAAGLLLVLSACSSIPGLKSAPSNTALATGQLSPLETLQRSVERQQEIKSFRSSMDMIVDAMGERMAMTADMEMAWDGRMRMVSSMDTPDGEMSFTVIVSESDLYMKMPGEDWVRIPGGAADGSMDQSLWPVEADLLGGFFSTEETPWHLFSVTSLGREHVDNVETEHLRVQVDLQGLWEEQPDETTQFIESMFSQQFLDDLMQMELELWIDDQGYPRRALIEMSVSDIVNMKMDALMYDFNEDIVIALPQSYS